ncbi:uncharacterized protein DNG_00426 [Cephalotrichum gorgonifer]|uniref:Uncharacterized protein n=1 Tax=Cephalotrichum gorgonifer TaxID=2041049 RepID=A0AAE8MPD9_9PEZI|nr:uncharacterized protein DNG_00426 [Cephalotrichum gorgonifer]
MSTHQAQPDTPAAAAAAAAPPRSPTSATASTSTDPRSARIEIWVEEVRRVAEPPPSPDPLHDQDQQRAPGWPSPREERGERILGGLRRLGRRLAGGGREREREQEREREREAGGEGTAMYSGAGAGAGAPGGTPGGDEDFDGGSSEGDVARGMRERGERLDRARRLLERSGKRQDTAGGPA